MNSEIPSQSPLGTEINISTSDLRVKEEESNQRKNNLGSVAGKACSRLRRSDEELEILSKHELIELWRQQNAYIESIEEQLAAETSSTQNSDHVRTLENRIKEQKLEATRKENILVMRLTIKDKEIQDLMNQIDELKRVQLPSDEQLKATLVDPAVNLLFEKMRTELKTSKAKVEEMQNELSAWKFTADSQTGKKLMAKCRLLYQENEELGKLVSSGRIAKLEGDLSLQKKLSEEMKKSQSELDEFLLELDEDVEGMQSTIYFLQQQLKEAKQALAKNATNGINDAESFSSQAPSSSSVKQLDIVENGKNSGTALEPDETTPMQCD